MSTLLEGLKGWVEGPATTSNTTVATVGGAYLSQDETDAWGDGAESDDFSDLSGMGELEAGDKMHDLDFDIELDLEVLDENLDLEIDHVASSVSLGVPCIPPQENLRDLDESWHDSDMSDASGDHSMYD